MDRSEYLLIQWEEWGARVISRYWKNSGPRHALLQSSVWTIWEEHYYTWSHELRQQDRVSHEDNQRLAAPFTREEIKKVVFSMEKKYCSWSIICLQDAWENAQNMKLLLYLYENMSGLKNNFNKSEVIMVSQDLQKNYAILWHFQLCCGAMANQISWSSSIWF